MDRAGRSHNIYEGFLSQAEGAMGDCALSYFGRGISYRGLFHQGERALRAFTRWGVGRSSPVFLLSEETPELLYALLALWKLGARPMLLSPHHSPREIQTLCGIFDPRLLLVLDRYGDLTREALGGRALLTPIILPLHQSMPFLLRRTRTEDAACTAAAMTLPRAVSWRDFLDSGYPAYHAPPEKCAFSDVAVELLGGEESRSLTHGVLREGFLLEEGKLTQRGGSFLGLVPLWEPLGLVWGTLLPLFSGMRLILAPDAAKIPVLQQLTREKPSHLFLRAEDWFSLLEEAKVAGLDLSFLGLALHDGSLSPEGEGLLQEGLRSLNSEANIRAAPAAFP